jgi:hypothetical protein
MNTSFQIENPEPPRSAYPNCYAPVPPNRGGPCPHTGLKHCHLMKLLKGPARKHVRTVYLREPGARHGKTVFHVGDALKFLDSQAEQQRLSEMQ